LLATAPGVLPCAAALGRCLTSSTVTQVDDLSFGRTTRYLQVFSKQMAADRALVAAWDSSVEAACEEYKGRMHNLCCDNCHSHVAFALNRLRYKGCAQWNMVILAAWMFFAGSFVSLSRAAYSLLPSLLLYGLILLLGGAGSGSRDG
jgi:hypothetical protein